MKIIKEFIEYKNFGRCVRLSNGKIEAVITADIGPRIIRFGFTGGKNFLFEDETREYSESGGDFDAAFGTGSKWYNYGGHRLWLSPEERPLTYYPDNDGVQVEFTEAGACFTPPVQRVTGAELCVTVELTGDGLEVTHGVTNRGCGVMEKALWAITVCAPGGLSVLPLPQKKTGLLPNKSITLWPYSDMRDARVYWGSKYFSIRQEPSIAQPFKLGYNNEKGWAAYYNHGGLFVKSFKPAGSVYPDFGCSYESYVCGGFIELETLSPLNRINPGETIFHTEKWRLFADVEKPEPENEEAFELTEQKYMGE